MSVAAAMQALEQKLEERLDRLSLDLRNRIYDKASQPGQGRTYRRVSPSGNVVLHTASAPGDGPAIDSGNLAQSIQTTKPRKLVRWVGVHGEDYPNAGTPLTTAKVARWLEWGNNRVAPRPFLRPALNEFRTARRL